VRSGRVADEYVDKYQFEAGPALPGEVAAALVPLVPQGTRVTPSRRPITAGRRARDEVISGLRRRYRPDW
jgi:hypothetical protein